MNTTGTIVALATAPGTGAIAIVRLSGPEAVPFAMRYFRNSKLQPLQRVPGARRATFGALVDGERIVDEVILTVYRQPHSYTGEDSVEIACHGSPYIQQQVLTLMLSAGARMAGPGEFTLRAFLNGRMDLSQAEAVADVIASSSELSHSVAMQQMRGGYSSRIRLLRDALVNFASLIELELDFAEEDVEFASRVDLAGLVKGLKETIDGMVKSFDLGNVIRNGIPVAIVGRPNAGKSTLLNALLDDDRAIVSDIPGTTRDTIEELLVIEGTPFRFIDTAGLRATSDVVEQIGVARSYEAMERSSVIIYLFDVHEETAASLQADLSSVRERMGPLRLLIVGNKIDTEEVDDLREEYGDIPEVLFISAKQGSGLEDLRQRLLGCFDARQAVELQTVVTNARHASALRNASAALEKILEGLQAEVPSDLLALDIRYALTELGTITGQVTTDDLLENIFTRFCIGK